MKQLKKNVLGFFAKVARKDKIKEGQASVMKYVDKLDALHPIERADGIYVDCPYCKLKSFTPKVGSKLPKGQVYTTNDPADFVEHLVQEHFKGMEIAKILWEIMYLQAALEDAE